MIALRGAAITAIFIIPACTLAQVLGTWDCHLPYRSAVSVTVSDDWVYCSTDIAYFQYHRRDQYVARKHKANGLSDVGAHIVAHHPEQDLLLVAYVNANVDIVRGDAVVNIPDIKKSAIIGHKTINHVLFDDHLAYLSCSFGIVVIDLDRHEVKDTYRPDSADIEVFATTILNGEIFASTQRGLYSASVSSGVNLLDYNSWHRHGSEEGLFDPDLDTGMVITLNNAVITRSHDTLFRFTGGTWEYFYHSPGWQAIHLSVSGNRLVVTEHVASGTQQPDSARITIIEANGTRQSYMKGQLAVPLQSVLADDGELWVADLHHGLKRYRLSDGNLVNIVPDGPFSNRVFGLDARNGKLCVAPGGMEATLNPFFNTDGFFIYENGAWTNYHQGAYPQLEGSYDWIITMIDPDDDERVYFGSHYSGLAVLDVGSITKIYDQNNSPLKLVINRTHVGGLAKDADGNLWLTNDGTFQPLFVLTPSQVWYSFEVPSSSKDIFKIVIDDFNQKWILTSRSPLEGIIVYDHGTDLADPSDDRSIVLNNQIGKGALPTNVVISIAKDHDGEIWVGTAEGIAVFYCPGEVLNNGCDASQIIVERDGFLGYLLEAEVVRDIKVDGANRKWVATDNGAFLLSPDGTTELLHFTSSNSPLLSNSVPTMAVDNKTGVVWFGTDMGINSYQGDAIEGASTHDCFIYPNPVRPDYTGPIVIKGLVQDADVRITDVAGGLVYQVKANGGIATWDGTLLSGARAHTGVYYVFSTASDGSDKTVCKLLFVN